MKCPRCSAEVEEQFMKCPACDKLLTKHVNVKNFREHFKDKFDIDFTTWMFRSAFIFYIVFLIPLFSFYMVRLINGDGYFSFWDWFIYERGMLGLGVLIAMGVFLYYCTTEKRGRAIFIFFAIILVLGFISEVIALIFE